VEKGGESRVSAADGLSSAANGKCHKCCLLSG